MKSISIFIGIVLSFLIPSLLYAEKKNTIQLTSPDKSILVEFKIEAGKALYSVYKNAKPIITTSSLGIEFQNLKPF